MPFYTRQRILSKYFIDKEFFAEYFFEHSVKNLPSVEKHSKKTLGKLRIKKAQKTAKYFLKIIGTALQPQSITIPIALSFFTFILNQIYMFCEWWDSNSILNQIYMFVNGEIRNSQSLSRAYPPLPLHYYINYVYITF